MAKIPCPGELPWRQTVRKIGKGLTPQEAVTNAFLQTLLDLSQNRGLKRLLESKCKGNCTSTVLGPNFTRFKADLKVDESGLYVYEMMATIEVIFRCEKKAKPISNEDLLEAIMSGEDVSHGCGCSDNTQVEFESYEMTGEEEGSHTAAFFDMANGLALVAQEDMDWLLECEDISMSKSGVLEVMFAEETAAFDVISVSRNIVAKTTPKIGTRRRWRHAKCGGNYPAQHVPCFKMSTGRYAKIEIAGYFSCILGPEDSYCDEEYVKVGDITIYSDKHCQIVAQRHPQNRWICLP